MRQVVLDEADSAGMDSCARRRQQGHQHPDRRPLAPPSRSGSPDKSPAPALQLASRTAAGSDGLRPDLVVVGRPAKILHHLAGSAARRLVSRRDVPVTVIVP
jgi:nucleotide-binding universal stress UspA family protein